MSAPQGNQFWMLRSSHGANPKFETPELLWEACQEYFASRDDMTWNKQKLPFTVVSLCMFLDISNETWTKWRDKDHDLSEIVKKVDEIIKEQKLTGAMVGAYNSSIIARDIGLADKQDVTANVTISHEDALDSLDD